MTSFDQACDQIHFGFLIETWNTISIEWAFIEVTFNNQFQPSLESHFNTDLNLKPKPYNSSHFDSRFVNPKT